MPQRRQMARRLPAPSSLGTLCALLLACILCTPTQAVLYLRSGSSLTYRRHSVVTRTSVAVPTAPTREALKTWLSTEMSLTLVSLVDFAAATAEELAQFHYTFFNDYLSSSQQEQVLEVLEHAPGDLSPDLLKIRTIVRVLLERAGRLKSSAPLHKSCSSLPHGSQLVSPLEAPQETPVSTEGSLSQSSGSIVIPRSSSIPIPNVSGHSQGKFDLPEFGASFSVNEHGRFLEKREFTAETYVPSTPIARSFMPSVSSAEGVAEKGGSSIFRALHSETEYTLNDLWGNDKRSKLGEEGQDGSEAKDREDDSSEGSSSDGEDAKRDTFPEDPSDEERVGKLAHMLGVTGLSSPDSSVFEMTLTAPSLDQGLVDPLEAGKPKPWAPSPAIFALPSQSEKKSKPSGTRADNGRQTYDKLNILRPKGTSTLVGRRTPSSLPSVTTTESGEQDIVYGAGLGVPSKLTTSNTNRGTNLGVDGDNPESY